MSEQALFASRKLVSLRFLSQGLLGAAPDTPVDAVQQLLCAQGQNLGAVLAALSLRSRAGLKEVREAFGNGAIVRGYPMRGTIFAVAAEDLAWLTAIGGAAAIRGAARRRQELGLTAALLERASDLVRAELAASETGALSRSVLADLLLRSGIIEDNGQRYHVFFHLIATGQLAYGPVAGRDHLLVDAKVWLPAGGTLEARFNGDELAAIGEWLIRYLHGHGPASLRDFCWWTKLPLNRVREAAAAVGIAGRCEEYGPDSLGDALWGRPGMRGEVEGLRDSVAVARLLPAFDEIVLGYPDRTYLVAAEHLRRIVPGNNGVFRPVAVIDNRIVGTWKVRGRGTGRSLDLEPFEPLSTRDLAQLDECFHAYPEW